MLRRGEDASLRTLSTKLAAADKFRTLTTLLKSKLTFFPPA
jgi:hypothetical protein